MALSGMRAAELTASHTHRVRQQQECSLFVCFGSCSVGKFEIMQVIIVANCGRATMALLSALVLTCVALVAISDASDPCQPHGETNVLTGECWGAGGSPGCFSCFYGDKCDM